MNPVIGNFAPQGLRIRIVVRSFGRPHDEELGNFLLVLRIDVLTVEVDTLTLSRLKGATRTRVRHDLEVCIRLQFVADRFVGQVLDADDARRDLADFIDRKCDGVEWRDDH